jgi:hypothetical protein
MQRHQDYEWKEGSDPERIRGNVRRIRAPEFPAGMEAVTGEPKEHVGARRFDSVGAAQSARLSTGSYAAFRTSSYMGSPMFGIQMPSRASIGEFLLPVDLREPFGDFVQGSRP